MAGPSALSEFLNKINKIMQSKTANEIEIKIYKNQKKHAKP